MREGEREGGREGEKETSEKPSQRVSQGLVIEVGPKTLNTPSLYVILEHRLDECSPGTCLHGQPLLCSPISTKAQWVGLSLLCRRHKETCPSPCGQEEVATDLELGPLHPVPSPFWSGRP